MVKMLQFFGLAVSASQANSANSCLGGSFTLMGEFGDSFAADFEGPMKGAVKTMTGVADLNLDSVTIAISTSGAAAPGDCAAAIAASPAPGNSTNNNSSDGSSSNGGNNGSDGGQESRLLFDQIIGMDAWSGLTRQLDSHAATEAHVGYTVIADEADIAAISTMMEGHGATTMLTVVNNAIMAAMAADSTLSAPTVTGSSVHTVEEPMVDTSDEQVTDDGTACATACPGVLEFAGPLANTMQMSDVCGEAALDCAMMALMDPSHACNTSETYLNLGLMRALCTAPTRLQIMQSQVIDPSACETACPGAIAVLGEFTYVNYQQTMRLENTGRRLDGHGRDMTERQAMWDVLCPSEDTVECFFDAARHESACTVTNDPPSRPEVMDTCSTGRPEGEWPLTSNAEPLTSTEDSNTGATDSGASSNVAADSNTTDADDSSKAIDAAMLPSLLFVLAVQFGVF